MKGYLHELEFSISSEDAAEELVVIDDEEKGIKNLIIDCEDPVLVLEQVIMDVPEKTEGFFNFEPLDPIKVKGKQEPVRVYKLLSERDKPTH